MAHIFISYKSEQRDLALTVQHKLLEWGYETWLDVDRLKPGDQWADEIDIALKTAHACLAIMTPASISSRYVTNEWDMAIMQGKLFIPLMFHKTDPHYKYVDIQYIDFSKPDRIESFDQLKARLADYHMNSTMTTIDPYREYLQQLYDRINRYLAAKLITSLRDEEGRPSPISLSINRSDDAVDVLFRKREEIDPLFAVGGLVDQSPQEFTDFIKAVEFYDGRVLLLGEPGSGKTITLLNFARDAVVKRFQDKTSPVPILGIVPTWDADKNVLLTEWLATSYGSPPDAIGLINSGNGILLLDGLDELGSSRPLNPNEPNGETYDPRVRFMEHLPEGTRIVLTCRLKDYDDSGLKVKLSGAVTLKPLSNKQMLDYLREQSEMLSFVQNNDDVRGWLSTPLALGYFAFAYDELSAAEKSSLANSQNTADALSKIYAQYMLRAYTQVKAKPNVHISYSLEQICEILGRLSVENLVGYSEVEGIFDESALKGVLGDTSNLIDFISLCVRMNVITSTSPQKYQFVHLTFRNYFAFEFAKNHLNEITQSRFYNRDHSLGALGKLKDVRALPYLVSMLHDRATYELKSEFIEVIRLILEDNRDYVFPSEWAQTLAPYLEADDPIIVFATCNLLTNLQTLSAWNLLADGLRKSSHHWIASLIALDLLRSPYQEQALFARTWLEEQNLRIKQSNKIKVVHIDDIMGVLKGVRQLVSLEGDIEVVAIAPDGLKGVQLIKYLRPDVIITGINMPIMDGLTATLLLTVQYPEIPVIILSVQTDADYVRRAKSNGAQDYLTKPPEADELASAIRSVTGDEANVKVATNPLNETEGINSKLFTILKYAEIVDPVVVERATKQLNVDYSIAGMVSVLRLQHNELAAHIIDWLKKPTHQKELHEVSAKLLEGLTNGDVATRAWSLFSLDQLIQWDEQHISIVAELLKEDSPTRFEALGSLTIRDLAKIVLEDIGTSESLTVLKNWESQHLE